jgi:UDP-hydrolysing UDP-N-acetyl-D-glucosamine 2-epimerase
MTAPRRIASISSSRADLGILAPVWRAVAALPGVTLELFLTGTHVGNDEAARAAAPHGVRCIVGGADLGGTDGPTAAVRMTEIARAAANAFAAIRPDLVIAVGDRLDMAPAVLAAVPFNVPVAHLHGGELTEGAVDDRLRHAITKLAHLHFAANVDAAERLFRMGEEAWRIHVVGGPGLDTLHAVPDLGRAETLRRLGCSADGPVRLVTLHPETNAADPLAPLDATLAALDRLPPASTVFTGPNADPGGAELRARILAFAADRPWTSFRESLGSEVYVNAMRQAAVMIGNSSSGIIEAPVLGLPAVNVGARQRSRIVGTNVVNCGDADAIVAALDRLAASGFARVAPSYPYGDGKASGRIAAALASLPDRRRLLEKRFADGAAGFAAPWAAA